MQLITAAQAKETSNKLLEESLNKALAIINEHIESNINTVSFDADIILNDPLLLNLDALDSNGTYMFENADTLSLVGTKLIEKIIEANYKIRLFKTKKDGSGVEFFIKLNWSD